MRRSPHRPPLPPPFQRCVAVLGMALVLWLNFLATSPDAHAWLHGHTDSHPQNNAAAHTHSGVPTDDATCVVTQFAHGKVDVVALPVFCPALIQRHAVSLFPVGSAAIVSPAHRLPPGCGPPLV